jgi:ABC-type Fe3+-siderophore transport system permease subunit
MIAHLRRSVREEACREWRVDPRLAEALFVLPFVGGLLVAASRANRGLFHFVTAEDRLLEWSQFVGYASGAGFAAAAAVLFFRRGKTSLAVWFALIGLGCFFIAGEEISWGQRIFGIETPESVAEVNRQEELSVHNITSIENLFRVGELLVGFAGSVGAWLAGGLRERLSPRARLLVPPVFLSSAFLTLFLWRAFRFGIYSAGKFTIVEFTEWPELCLALALAVYSFLVWRRIRASPAALA